MTKDELIAVYNQLTNNTLIGTGFYIEEIARRDSEEKTTRMLDLTHQMKKLGVVITFLAILNLIFVSASLFLR
jgi:hypothetical protein